ncbi:MAG: MauE/DoxX family redox-associated membrane protein [Mesonia sp.]|uniref:MauE/DoxX family redox-associated membrane protein n=1 Tax=Mesonia sp. TaxID=1960830 RepID=UPI003F9A0F90
MKAHAHILQLIRYIFLLLFFYAGLTKLLEGELFYDNLYNSPLLPKNSILISILAWGIPLLEMGIALCLLFPKYLKPVLKGIISLLVIYSIYIAAILWWSPYQPCSCGGVSKLLSWEQHLLLNGVGVALSLMALYKLKKHGKDDNYINR